MGNDTRCSALHHLCEKDPDMGVMWKLQLPPQQSGNLAVRAALTLIYPRTGIEALVWASLCHVGQHDPTETTSSNEGSLVFRRSCAHIRRVGLERSRPLWNNRALMGCG